MSGLHYLSTEDFIIAKGIKGPVLCNTIRGFSLILFYSDKCPHSRALLPIFKRLPGSVGSCQFGMINVDRNMHCIGMSKRTIAPVEYVPYVVLYVNGKPYMSYKGPHEMEDIKRFIFDVSQNVSKKLHASAVGSGAAQAGRVAPVIRHDAKKAIPEYTLGSPLCGDDKVTYLEFSPAEGYKSHEGGKTQAGGYVAGSKVLIGFDGYQR